MLWVLGRLWNWLFHEPFANAAGVFVAGAADVAGAVGASDLLTSGFSADTAGVVAGNPVYGCGRASGTSITGAGFGISSGAGAGGTGPGCCVVGGVASPDFDVVSVIAAVCFRYCVVRAVTDFSGCVSVVDCQDW